MSPGGTLAIAQRGQVSVYTPMFEEIFTFYTSEHVTAMAFAGDNKHCLLYTSRAIWPRC